MLNAARCAIVALAFASLATACEEYVAPPDLELDFPPEGTFIEGDPLALSFSEPIDPSTLRVRVWSDKRDRDGILPGDLAPLLDNCTVAASPCDGEGSTLVVADDGMSATLVLSNEGIGKPDVPLLLEVLPGLRSAETRVTVARARIFDFQFKPAEVNEEPVPFEEGEYLFVSVFTEPLPNVITLISDVQTTDDGRFYIVGAEGDNYPDTDQSTTNPDDLFIDETDQGFVIFAVGTIRQNDREERFVETDRFDVRLLLLDFDIRISGMRFTGVVVKNQDTGRDQIRGTLSYESLRLLNANTGRQLFEYAAATTTFVADQIPAEKHIDGTPSMCGDPCGTVIAQCEIPEVWPPEGVCDDGEAEGSQ